MSTATSTSTLSEPIDPIELASLPRIPLSRLTRVELRKLTNTRSGSWLIIGIGVITLLVVVAFFATSSHSERTFFNFMAATNGPQGLLLPVMGILLVTSEWTQRTALVSFTLVPVRGRVVAAKFLAGLLAGLGAIVLAIAVAALATTIAGADGAWTGVGVDDVGKLGLLQVTGVIQGLAFGLLFLNSSAAIVSYFVLPTAISLLAMMWQALADVQAWIDLWSSQSPLFMGGDLTTEQWCQIGTSSTIWVVLPLAIGLVRVLRSEVK